MVDFVRRATTARIAGVIGGVPPRYAVKIGGFFSSLNIWFWAIVGLPTLLAGVYFFGIASDLYMSEVKFVVRGPTKSPASAISSMLSSAGASAVSEEVIAVGDHRFQRRSQDELFEKRADRSLILASHVPDIIREYCSRALVLHRGRGKMFDDLELAFDIYSDL